jgi:Tol biopolymer transport system component
LLLHAACNYPPLPLLGGAPGSGTGDGSSAQPDCFGHWMDGSVAIDASTVQEITELSSAGQEVAPWISSDGLRIYFSRDGAQLGHGDIYFASRSSPTGTFTAATPVVNLNSLNEEERTWLTSNELAIALSTARDGQLDIHMITRNPGQMFATPIATHLATVNATGTNHYEPFLTDDLLRLYFSANTGPSGKLQLWIASRSTAADDFGAPSLIPGIDNSFLNEFSPALYQGERLLVFSSFLNAGTADLYYATRSSATSSFGTPVKVPTVNTTASEYEGVLSADGCELYFASNRDADGHFHLFHARITR